MFVIAVASTLAYFGVNYYPPFSVDYDEIARMGLDHRTVIQGDVQHFKRLGIDAVRLHCFDRQISTKDGDLVVNSHVELLDWLIDHCSSNGIKTVLTPIAWWGGKFAPDKEGFSNAWTMEQMTSDPDALKAQVRYLAAFGERYGNNPGVVAFELINEPLYKEDFPDEKVTEYINALADAIRSSGTDKPVFYNSWKGHNAAAGMACIDGISGCCYATGLNAEHEWTGDLLSKVKATTLDPMSAPDCKRRMIYEFDAPCTDSSYLYPAMARLFRHEGAELAFQFQYDPLPVAHDNRNWKNHYLNLVYTPSKAISLAIAAEVFRREPLGCDFVRSRGEMVFPPFRVDARRNLAQMTTVTDFLYTSDPIDEPGNPSTLRRIWGVGRSSLASCDGKGAYFLDKLEDGVWRLQLYPDVRVLAESNSSDAEVLALSRTLEFWAHLPGVGDSWRVTSVPDLKEVDRTVGDPVHLPPGDYLIDDGTRSVSELRRAIGAKALPRFVVPALSDESVESIAKRTVAEEKGTKQMTALPLFDVCRSMSAPLEGAKWGGRSVTTDDFGFSALRLHVPAGNAPICGYVGVKSSFDNEGLCGFDMSRRGAKYVIIRAKGGADGEKMEVVFTQSDETAWGTTITLSTEWKRHVIRISDLKPKWDTLNMTWRDSAANPDKFASLNLGFGKWLFDGDGMNRDHVVEVSAVDLCSSVCTLGNSWLQKEVDASGKSGGGRVSVPAGRHVTGSVMLRSNVELHLEEGAVLVGSDRAEDYVVIKPEFSEGDLFAVVMADCATNVSVTGTGEIFGDGGRWKRHSTFGSDTEGLRPRGLVFKDCKDVYIEDVTLRDAACWGCVFHCCDGVTVRRMTIDSHAIGNNDGFDIEAKNVLIEDCDVDTGDDSYVIKSNNRDFITENVVVRNCIGRSTSNVFKLGTASHGTMRNILFENCRTEAARRGFCNADGKDWFVEYREKYWPGASNGANSLSAIAIENVDGGVVSNVVFRSISAKDSLVPIFVRGGKRMRRGCGIPPNDKYVFEGIRIENVNACAESFVASSITGVSGCRPRNVVLRNVRILCKGGGRTAAERTRPVPEVPGEYPESRMFGCMLPAYGLYVRHVDGIRLDGLTFSLHAGTSDERDAIVLDDATQVLASNTDSKVLLKGFLGEKLDAMIAHQVATTDIDYITAPFMEKTEMKNWWQTEFWGKWMHSAMPYLAYSGNEKLRASVERGIDRVLASQESNGYIGNYPDGFRCGDGWDVWGMKYTMMGLLHYYDATGSLMAIDSCRRLCDYVITEIGPNGRRGRDLWETGNWSGYASSSILEPVMWLYKRTNDRKYLEFASYIVKGMTEPAAGPRLIDLALKGIPVADRNGYGNRQEAHGRYVMKHNRSKAYEMMSCYQGLLEYYECTGRKEVFNAVQMTAEDIVKEEANFAGGCACSEAWFHGAKKQHLPCVRLQETCVTITWMRLCEKLLTLTGNTKWADQIERTFYNAYLGAMSPGCSEFAAYTPLTGNRWHGMNHCFMHTDCCTANGPRGFLCFLKELFTTRGDIATFNFYSSALVKGRLSDRRKVAFDMYSLYPRTDYVRIVSHTEGAAPVRLRIPALSAKTAVKLNGNVLDGVRAGGYFTIDRDWKLGDIIEIKFDMPVVAHTLDHHVAFTCGPVLLARDSRFADGDMTEPFRRGIKDGQIMSMFSAVRTPSDDIWMAFSATLPIGSHTENPEAGNPSTVFFCDYASAGNTWTRANFYRTWFPVEYGNNE